MEGEARAVRWKALAITALVYIAFRLTPLKSINVLLFFVIVAGTALVYCVILRL